MKPINNSQEDKIINLFEILSNDDILNMLQIIDKTYLKGDVLKYLFNRYVISKDHKFGEIIKQLINTSKENVIEFTEVRDTENILIEYKKAFSQFDPDINLLMDFIRKGVDPNTPCDWMGYDDTILHLVASYNRVDLIDELIKFGNAKSIIEAKNKDDETPLIYAILNNSVEAVNKLIKVGADVNNGDDYPPLSQAIFKGNLNIIELLLEAGADITCSCEDMSLIDYTKKVRSGENCSNIIKLLEEYLNKKLRFELNNMWLRDLNKCIKFIECGADINTQDKDGLTTLHIASDRGDLDAVKYLVENKANINIQDATGRTPLVYAVEIYRNDEVIKYLIEQGADKNIKMMSGRTALFSAVEYRSIEIVKLLIDKDNIEDKDTYGKSILDIVNHTSHNLFCEDIKKLIEDILFEKYNIKELYEIYDNYQKVDWKSHKKLLMQYSYRINNLKYTNNFKYL